MLVRVTKSRAKLHCKKCALLGYEGGCAEEIECLFFFLSKIWKSVISIIILNLLGKKPYVW